MKIKAVLHVIFVYFMAAFAMPFLAVAVGIAVYKLIGMF